MDNQLREKFEQILTQHQLTHNVDPDWLNKLPDLKQFILSCMEESAKSESEASVGDGWKPIITKTDISRTVCLFDNGEMCFYNDENWPFAQVVGIFELPQPPQQ